MFCRIAAHRAPATIRYEDADLIAFDAEPAATPLHVLVIPRAHIRSVADLTDADLAGRLVLAASRIAADAGDEMGHPAGIAFSRRKREP